MIKNYFRILNKPHAYLQTILKTPVKFQKDRTKTLGGVKGTKYLLKTRNHAPRATRHAPRTTHHGKPKAVSLHFSSKRRGTKKKKKKKKKKEENASFRMKLIEKSEDFLFTIHREIDFVVISLPLKEKEKERKKKGKRKKKKINSNFFPH